VTFILAELFRGIETPNPLVGVRKIPDPDLHTVKKKNIVLLEKLVQAQDMLNLVRYRYFISIQNVPVDPDPLVRFTDPDPSIIKQK
jgi:hypothetical protein